MRECQTGRLHIAFEDIEDITVYRGHISHLHNCITNHFMK